MENGKHHKEMGERWKDGEGEEIDQKNMGMKIKWKEIKDGWQGLGRASNSTIIFFLAKSTHRKLSAENSHLQKSVPSESCKCWGSPGFKNFH